MAIAGRILWESHLQEVIAAGWSICGLRRAPDGRIMDVQSAICSGPAARARMPHRYHTWRMTFPKCQGLGQCLHPLGVFSTLPRHCASDVPSRTPGNLLDWSDTSMWCICCSVEWAQQSGSKLQHGLLISQRSWLFLMVRQVFGQHHFLSTGGPLPESVSAGLSTGSEGLDLYCTANVIYSTRLHFRHCAPGQSGPF